MVAWVIRNLDQLLSLYLPKNDKVYQLEYRLKKPTGKGGFLVVDAIIFGIDGKNNIAIDSKFPLEKFLLLHQENLLDLEKKEIEKNFKNNLKDHIKKVAEYVSELDGTEHVVMFIPSEAVFAKINEHSYYEIMEFCFGKESLSLLTGYFSDYYQSNSLNYQNLWTIYRSMDQVLLELKSFWEDFGRFQERWTKIQELVAKSNKSLEDFNISVQKLVKKGKGIQKREVIPLTEKEKLE